MSAEVELWMLEGSIYLISRIPYLILFGLFKIQKRLSFCVPKCLIITDYQFGYASSLNGENIFSLFC